MVFLIKVQIQFKEAQGIALKIHKHLQHQQEGALLACS